MENVFFSAQPRRTRRLGGEIAAQNELTAESPSTQSTRRVEPGVYDRPCDAGNRDKAGYNPYALATALNRMAREQKEEMGSDQYRQDQFIAMLFGSHPPTAQRSMALSLESNFVKMPAKDSRYQSPAFAAMKLRITDRSK